MCDPLQDIADEKFPCVTMKDFSEARRGVRPQHPSLVHVQFWIFQNDIVVKWTLHVAIQVFTILDETSS